MPLSDLYEEFVGVTAINKSFTARLVNTPGMLGGPILPGSPGTAGPRRRGPRRVGEGRSVEQFGLYRRRQWPTGSYRNGMAAAARCGRRAVDLVLVARLLTIDGEAGARGGRIHGQVGWACAVLIGGTRSSPRLIDSRPGFEMERSRHSRRDAALSCRFRHRARCGAELTRLVASVRRYGLKSVSALIREYQQGGTLGLGVVVGSLIDPERSATLTSASTRWNDSCFAKC